MKIERRKTNNYGLKYFRSKSFNYDHKELRSKSSRKDLIIYFTKKGLVWDRLNKLNLKTLLLMFNNQNRKEAKQCLKYFNVA